MKTCNHTVLINKRTLAPLSPLPPESGLIFFWSLCMQIFRNIESGDEMNSEKSKLEIQVKEFAQSHLSKCDWESDLKIAFENAHYLTKSGKNLNLFSDKSISSDFYIINF